MAGKKQYWLITVQERWIAAWQTRPIAEHPADYMAKNIEDALIFAMPITQQQFKAVDKAYSG
jgi:hypothetical protein